MIQISSLSYDYGNSAFRLLIDKLEIQAGEKVALIGPSGSGKTTLLQLISGTRSAQRGNVTIDGQSFGDLSDGQRREFRATKIGFVFQDFELIEYLRVSENIKLPFLIHSKMKFLAEHQQRLERLAKETGLSDKLNRFPDQLSQGERQRVALCRALLTQPRVFLADEPTGSLDPSTASEVLNLLLQQVSNSGATLVMVTHDHSLISRFDRTIDIKSLVSSSPIQAMVGP